MVTSSHKHPAWLSFKSKWVYWKIGTTVAPVWAWLGAHLTPVAVNWGHLNVDIMSLHRRARNCFRMPVISTPKAEIPTRCTAMWCDSGAERNANLYGLHTQSTPFNSGSVLLCVIVMTSMGEIDVVGGVVVTHLVCILRLCTYLTASLFYRAAHTVPSVCTSITTD